MCISLPNRRAPFGFAVLWIFFALLLSLTQAQAQTSFPDLQRLYSAKRYFELRDRLQKIGKDNRSPELEFFQGAVDNMFNRLPSSLTHLLGYLERTGGSQPAIWARECYDLLADSYRKSFQYARAAETNEKILILFRNELSDTERADHENEFKLWEALKDTPAQTVKFVGDTAVQIKLGLKIIDVPIRVGTITGEKIDARVGVAAELRIGNMTVRHSLFLVMKDEYFYIPEIKRQIQGVLGFPVLAAMREVTFTRKGELLIPAEPQTQGEQNLALAGFKPLIEGHYKEKRLTFVLDTGANRPDLWPPFLAAFADDIKGSSELRTERFRGAGSRREVKAYSLRDLVLQVSGRDVTFRRIPVFTEYTTENSRFFYGNLGQDLVRQFASMTINFENMCVVFNLR